jgi:hypothetical protein
VPAAVVSVLGAGGAELARVLTDTAGRYSLPRAADAAAVRVRRIGYLPAERRLGPTQGGLTLEFVITRVPQNLPTVMSQSRCARGGSPEQAFAL